MMMLRVVDPHQHPKAGLAFENALILSTPSEEPCFISTEGFERMLLSPADSCNPHGTTVLAEPPIYPSEHQIKQYLNMRNESAGFDMVLQADAQPERHSHTYWPGSPSILKTGRKRARCYDLRSQLTTHSSGKSGLILPPDDKTRDYGYGPIPPVSSDVHGPIEGSSITSYSESESETSSSGFSLSPNAHDHDNDFPCTLATQVGDPPGLYMGVPGFNRDQFAPVTSETSVCPYDKSVNDDCKPASQSTSRATGDCSAGSMLQDSPSVGTATDSFESSCGAVTPLSWSAFGVPHLSQEEPGYGDAHAHALWPSTQQYQDEPATSFVAITATSFFNSIPRVGSDDGLPLPLPEEYQYHSQRYNHQAQQPIPVTPYPGTFDIPLTKDQTVAGQAQIQLTTDMLPLSYHMNPHPHSNPYHTEYIPRRAKFTPTSTTDNINTDITTHYNNLTQQPTKPIPCQIDTRNALLLEYKRRGLSYKDIKRIGGFREAESTLRGRFRTLTKTKDQRVRKPLWSEKDIRLLCEAVSAHAERTTATTAAVHTLRAERPRVPKVSWKKVAQYIWAHGGSYHFGNATCKKKWCEVHGVDG